LSFLRRNFSSHSSFGFVFSAATASSSAFNSPLRVSISFLRVPISTLMLSISFLSSSDTGGRDEGEDDAEEESGEEEEEEDEEEEEEGEGEGDDIGTRGI
jgi:hypothetical protein